MVTMQLGIEAGPHTLDVAAAHGVRGVPISAEGLAADGVEETLAPLRARGLEVCQIGAFGYNPLSTDSEAQKRQRAILMQTIPLAPRTGCRYIVICGGNYDPSGFGRADARNFTDEAVEAAARELIPVVRLAEEHGVIISVEPYLKTVVGTPERFLALHERVGSEALRCNLDVTNFYGWDEMWDARRSVAHSCLTLAGHYGLVHVKDLTLADGFHMHIGMAPLSRGVTDWADMLTRAAPYVPTDSWVVLEHIATPEEATESLALLRTAAERAGVILQ